MTDDNKERLNLQDLAKISGGHDIFCDIARGNLNADIVYEDELLIAFRPNNDKDLIVVQSRNHYENYKKIAPSDFAMLMIAIQRLVNQFPAMFGAKSCRLSFENEETVDHFYCVIYLIR